VGGGRTSKGMRLGLCYVNDSCVMETTFDSLPRFAAPAEIKGLASMSGAQCHQLRQQLTPTRRAVF
jgi:hypothetical protein